MKRIELETLCAAVRGDVEGVENRLSLIDREPVVQSLAILQAIKDGYGLDRMPSGLTANEAAHLLAGIGGVQSGQETWFSQKLTGTVVAAHGTMTMFWRVGEYASTRTIGGAIVGGATTIESEGRDVSSAHWTRIDFVGFRHSRWGFNQRAYFGYVKATDATLWSPGATAEPGIYGGWLDGLNNGVADRLWTPGTLAPPGYAPIIYIGVGHDNTAPADYIVRVSGYTGPSVTFPHVVASSLAIGRTGPFG